MAMSRRSLVTVLIVEAAFALVTLATLADLRAHWQRGEVRDVNMWGFRGKPRLKPVGLRVAVIGGSAAYGYGVDWENSLPYYLDSALERWGQKQPHPVIVDAVNLAALGDGAASYINTLETYRYLQPDLVCIYDGYSGVGATGVYGSRHVSPVFRATGYFPILGDVLTGREPRMAADRAVVDPMLRDDASGDVTCAGGSRAYCDAMIRAVAWSIEQGMRVAVVTPPYVSHRHEAQQTSLAAALASRFAGERRVRYVNMGRFLDLRDRVESFDGVHLTPRGNQTLAQELTPPLFEVLRR
jgi:hypothetical protein